MEVHSSASKEFLTGLTAKVVAAYVGQNTLPFDQLPGVIATVYGSFANLEKLPESVAEIKAPAIAIKKSVTPDYIVCLEDGKKLKMLKRHLRSTYGMSPEEYRAKWGLPPEYPMVAPNYAKSRSEMAVRFGLGRKTASSDTGSPRRTTRGAAK